MNLPFRTIEDYELFLIPAPEMSFQQPNLPALVSEIENLLQEIESEKERHG